MSEFLLFFVRKAAALPALKFMSCFLILLSTARCRAQFEGNQSSPARLLTWKKSPSYLIANPRSVCRPVHYLFCFRFSRRLTFIDHSLFSVFSFFEIRPVLLFQYFLAHTLVHNRMGGGKHRIITWQFFQDFLSLLSSYRRPMFFLSVTQNYAF